MSPSRRRLATVPNALSVARILAVPPLIWLAWQGQRSLFLALLLCMLLSDWVDGKLAVALDQTTEWGARLDSAADGLMYAATALSFWWLEPEIILGELAWLAAVVATWMLSAGVALTRFGDLPTYHTRAAKIGWLVAGGVALYTVWTGDGAGVPWALAWVVVTNVEAVAIGLVLPGARTQIPSLVHAIRARRGRDPS